MPHFVCRVRGLGRQNCNECMVNWIAMGWPYRDGCPWSKDWVGSINVRIACFKERGEKRGAERTGSR